MTYFLSPGVTVLRAVTYVSAKKTQKLHVYHGCGRVAVAALTPERDNGRGAKSSRAYRRLLVVNKLAEEELVRVVRAGWPSCRWNEWDFALAQVQQFTG